jgi:hypothetical protein
VSAQYTFPRPDLLALADALRIRLGDRSRPIGSPDELTTAIVAAVGEAEPVGRVEVLRIPAALHTPETWRVRLDGVSVSTRDVLESLLSEVRGVR